MDHPRPAPGVLLGEWEIPDDVHLSNEQVPRSWSVLPGAHVVTDVLSQDDCTALRTAFHDVSTVPVGVHGIPGSSVSAGSQRATAWSPRLAEHVWARLARVVPAERVCGDRTLTDWHTPVPYQRWRTAGVSPVMRFMKYGPGGRHYAHYDAAYDYGDGRRTLCSVVLYLTTVPQGSGGHTRFIWDGQNHLPIQRRSHDDWTRLTRDEEVVASVRPSAGDALVFDHRMCHDVETFTGDERVIIRTDLVYEAVR